MIEITTPFLRQEDVDTARRAWTSYRRERRPASGLQFNIRPISEAWRIAGRSPAYRTAVANVAYIWRDSGPVDQFGPMPRAFSERRCELRSSGLLLPATAPVWATEGYTIWDAADRAARATDDFTEVSAWHVVMEIPKALPSKNWTRLATSFVEGELVAKGAIVAWAIHAMEGHADDWIIAPHVHLVVTARYWRRGERHGKRHPGWLPSWQAHRRLELSWRRHCALAVDAMNIGWRLDQAVGRR
ncbi:MobA/MobL family protein [Sphingomonas sp. R1]|uniref:MobA/MobL family protein n=1 Tax=Sphingomonas sp. R1 TaxID=399176 RepID=UPI00222471D5|nr:MobA/MobL family protein [Sphingomonas sp. R1]UYY77356.1 MobA/MobL family protein [Sphingomonas sp. R1]